MPKKPTPEDDKATIAGLRADVMQISKERDVALAEVARRPTLPQVYRWIDAMRSTFAEACKRAVTLTDWPPSLLAMTMDVGKEAKGDGVDDSVADMPRKGRASDSAEGTTSADPRVCGVSSQSTPSPKPAPRMVTLQQAKAWCLQHTSAISMAFGGTMETAKTANSVKLPFSLIVALEEEAKEEACRKAGPAMVTQRADNASPEPPAQMCLCGHPFRAHGEAGNNLGKLPCLFCDCSKFIPAATSAVPSAHPDMCPLCEGDGRCPSCDGSGVGIVGPHEPTVGRDPDEPDDPWFICKRCCTEFPRSRMVDSGVFGCPECDGSGRAASARKDEGASPLGEGSTPIPPAVPPSGKAFKDARDAEVDEAIRNMGAPIVTPVKSTPTSEPEVPTPRLGMRVSCRSDHERRGVVRGRRWDGSGWNVGIDCGEADLRWVALEKFGYEWGVDVSPLPAPD